MRAIILSAGLGERLRPLTSVRAKPAIEFLNMPMLAFPYFWLDSLSLKEVTFNTHHLPETIRHAAMHVVDPKVQLHFPHEDAILGSGGGIWNARFHLQGDRNFAIANGDGVIVCKNRHALNEVLKRHEAEDALATILVCPLEGVGTRIPGVWMNQEGKVWGFGKTSPQPILECFHYASFMILSERIWDRLPQGSSNIIYDVLEPAIREGEKVIGHRVDDMRWFETGNVSDYLIATQSCLQYLKEQNAFGQNLKQMIDRFARNSELVSRGQDLGLVDSSAQLDPSSQAHGFFVIGGQCQVESFAQIENSVLLPGSQLLAGQVVQNQVLI